MEVFFANPCFADSGVLAGLNGGNSLQPQDKVTILYEVFGESKELTKDWGYSSLVEHNGKRILFDTGNDAAFFERNVKAMGVAQSRSTVAPRDPHYNRYFELTTRQKTSFLRSSPFAHIRDSSSRASSKTCCGCSVGARISNRV